MSRTRLAVLISMLGVGLPWTVAIHAADMDTRETVVRNALGLSMPGTTVAGGREQRDARAPLSRATRPKAVDERWDAVSLGLDVARRGDDRAARNDGASMEAGRIKSVLGLDPGRDAVARSVAAASVAASAARRPITRQAAASQPRRGVQSTGGARSASVEELAFNEPPALQDESATDRPTMPDTILPSVVSGPSEQGPRSPRDSDPAPRPRSPGHDDPLPAIADASAGAQRRGNFLTTAGLSIPPDDETFPGNRRKPHDEDPLFALLQVLPDAVADRERVASRVPVPSATDDPGLSADVFRHVTVEIERLATLSIDRDSSAQVNAASDGPLDVPGAARLLATAPDGTIDPIAPIIADARVADRPRLPVASLATSDEVQGVSIDEGAASRDPHPVEATVAGPAQTLARFDAVPVEPASTEPLLARHLPDYVGHQTIDIFRPLAAEVLMVKLEAVHLPSQNEPYKLHALPVAGEEPALSAQANPRPTMLVDIFDPDVSLPRTQVRGPRQHDRIAVPRPVQDPVATIDRGETEERARASNPDLGRDRRRADDVFTPIVAVPHPSRTNAQEIARDSSRLDPLQGTMVAVADSRLEEMRGGFETDAGLKISFGIERAVYVNGALASTTSFNVGDVNKMTAGQAQSAGMDRATLGLIQSGPNSTFTASQIASTSVATVIQNSLNGQKIQAVTQINATVNSLDMVRRADIQSRIQGALTDSMRR